jgi:adenylylsulfate kinase
MRAGDLSLAAARSGTVSFVALVSPFADARELVRERHREAGVGFVEVHVSASASVCAARDVKGLYAAQRAGRLRGLTGVDAPYETPVDPELVVRTDAAPAATCAASIVSVVASTLSTIPQIRAECDE